MTNDEINDRAEAIVENITPVWQHREAVHAIIANALRDAVDAALADVEEDTDLEDSRPGQYLA
jgi:hypothetical protein